MAFVKDIALTFEVSPGNWQTLFCAKSAELSVTTDTLQSTDTSQGKFKAFVATSNSATMNIGGIVKYDAAFHSVDVLSLQLQLLPLRVRYALLDLNGDSIAYVESDAIITTSNFNGSVFQLLETSHTLQLSGFIQLTES
jgi:hypothetical protein